MSGKLELGAYLIDMIDKVGQGTFGVVYRGIHTVTKQQIAAKQCELKEEKAGAIAMAEIKHFQHLQKHPHIVKLFDFNYKMKSFWLLMEYCDAGDLNKFYYEKNPSLSVQKNIMFECASAVNYMHSQTKAVVHRDIKPANIIMKQQGSEAIVKITDFGLSKMVELPDPAMTLMFNTKCGTPGFMAPEFFVTGKKDFGKAVDVFSLGLVCLAMHFHKPGSRMLSPQIGPVMCPIGQDMAFRKENNLPLPELVEECSEDSHELTVIKQMIKRMTVYKASDRAKMVEVVSILTAIGGKSPMVLPCPTKASGDGAGETEEEEDESKKNSGDVGFVMVQRALQQAHKEKHNLDDETIAKEGIGDMALHEMLADVMTDRLASDRLTVGEKVKVDTDQKRAERLQVGYGEWRDGMERYLGQYGIVTGAKRNVKVKFDDGRTLLFNPKLLIRTGEVPYEPEQLALFEDQDMELIKDMFKRYDIVKTPTDAEVVKCMQEQNKAGWNPRMKDILGTNGIVNRVRSANEVYVEFLNDNNWWLHPDILSHVDMSGYEIEAGDYIVVIDDKDLMLKFKPMFDNWNDQQLEVLGEAGIVKRVISSKQVVVDMGKKSYTWHPMLLKLWAKGEDVMAAILKQNQRR